MTDISNKMNAALGSVARAGFKLVTSGIPTMPYYRIDGVSSVHFAWVDNVFKGLYLLGHHNHLSLPIPARILKNTVLMPRLSDMEMVKFLKTA